MQRRLAFGGLGEQAGQATHLGGHPGRSDEDFDASARHDRVHEHHVVPFGQYRLVVDRRRQLGHRLRFPGQRGFGHFGAVCREDAPVGRDAVAGFEQQQVARNQARCFDLAHLAAAAHAGGWRQHVLEGGQRGFGAVFLEETEGRVEQDHDPDDDGVLDLADRAGEDRSAEQDDDQGIAELVEELQPRRPRRLLGEDVGAVVGQTLRGFCLRQAADGIRRETAGRFLDRERVPADVGIDGHAEGGIQGLHVAGERAGYLPGRRLIGRVPAT